MLKPIFSFLTCTFISASAFSQIGGRNSFEFVDMAVNAHVAGIGGVNVSLYDQDINLVFQNPALFNDKVYKNFSMNYLPFFADVKASSLVYGDNFGKYGRYAMGMQYLNFGTMDATDPSGNNIGTFHPYEYVFLGSTSHTIGFYTLGATLKFAGSRIDTYSSMAAMADLGGVFKHPKKDFSIGLVVKNAGLALKKYTPDTKVALPFDVQVGSSYKPEHMPLRLSLTAHHLQQFDIVYLDPAKKGVMDLEGNEIKPKKTFADKLGRHFVVGGELILHKNFQIRMGYNYLRRRELRLQTKSGGAGFSFGFMMRIKSFEFAYSRAYYHVAGGANYLTLTMNLDKLRKKKVKNTSNE